MNLTNLQISRLCRSLSVLLHCGLTVSDGLYLLAQEENELCPLLTRLGSRMDEGIPLSDAMEESGQLPTYVIGMVRLSEHSGQLEETLNRLAAFYDRREQTSRQIKNAVAYPSMLMGLMCLVIGVLLTQVLPVFDRVYASLGGQLTGVGGWLLAAGLVLRNALPALLAVLLAVTVVGISITLVPELRHKTAAFLSKHFGDRGVFRHINNAQFTQALAVGMAAGLPIEEALALACGVLSDIPEAYSRCTACYDAIAQGADLTDALGHAQLLKPSDSRLLTLGIRGGSGDRTMSDIAQRLSREADQALETAVGRIEPAMVLGGSLLVGIILLAVMLPLLNIMSTIG